MSPASTSHAPMMTQSPGSVSLASASSGSGSVATSASSARARARAGSGGGHHPSAMTSSSSLADASGSQVTFARRRSSGATSSTAHHLLPQNPAPRRHSSKHLRPSHAPLHARRSTHTPSDSISRTLSPGATHTTATAATSSSSSDSGTRLFRPPDPGPEPVTSRPTHPSAQAKPEPVHVRVDGGVDESDGDNGGNRSFPCDPTSSSFSSSVGPVLSLAFPAVKDVRGVEGVSGLWHVFTRCKAHLADGDRLENISWRLWYQACAQRHHLAAAAGDEAARPSKSGESAIVQESLPAKDRMVAVGGVYGSPVDDDDDDDSDDFEDEDVEPSADGLEGSQDVGEHAVRKQTSIPDLLPRSRRLSRNGRPVQRPAAFATGAQKSSSRSPAAGAPGRRRSSAGSSVSRRSSGSLAPAAGAAAGVGQGLPAASAASPTPIVIAPPASETSPSGPTLKASSYPSATPSQSFVNSRPSLSSMRTRSTLAAPAAGAHLMRRLVDRSFGEVLTDVFKTSSLQDLSTAAKRVDAGAAAAVPTTPSLTAATSLHLGPRASRRPNPDLHTISQEATPMPSPRREPSSGPELRLVEPTPAPSRVGSLGTTTPVASAMAASPTRVTSPRSVSFGESATKMVYSPQEEIQDPMERQGGDTALSETALAKLDQQQEEQHQQDPQPKKGKKSIFFIHSGSGDKRQQQRQGSMSGSDFSTETASTLGEAGLKRPNGGESVKQMATSPLARVSESRRASEDKPIAEPAVDHPAPRSPSRAVEEDSRPANLHRTSSKRSTGSSAMKRTTSGHKQPPKRTGTSAAHMAGKFNGEKARAAAAIAARLQAQQEKERAEQAEKRQKLSLAKRQRSEPNLVQQTDDSDGWSSETEEAPTENGDGYLSFGKKTKTPPMDLAKAADEAQRQRELFAKRAIFGSVSAEPGSTGSGLSTSHGSRGLLSNLFNSQRDVIRRGESMVDLDEQIRPAAAAPPPPLSFNRSKSVVAMPMTTGVSVGREGLLEPEMKQVDRSPEAALKTSRSRLRLPPKPGDMDLSPDSSPDNAGGIDKTEAIRRLEALTNKRDEPELTRTTSHPLPLPLPAYQHLEPALPQTPTTRRRQMLATELPEDLRLNLIWERQSRMPKLPPKRAITLRASASHHDLPDQTRLASSAAAAPPSGLGGPESSGMTRQHSNPVERIERSPEKPAQTAEPPRRKAPNLLSGGALLRPLTTAVRKPDPPQESSVREREQARSDQFASRRSKSTVDMTQLGQRRHGGFDEMNSSTTDEADTPTFTRRRTEGVGFRRDEWQPPARQKTLKEREGELSSSFRSHGW